MHRRKPVKKRGAANVVGAGAAGGGAGTVIAALANNLPDGSRWKSLLILCSPLFAVCFSGLWLFVKAVYIDPFANGQRQRATDAAMEKILSDARANAQRVLDNPHSSKEHKREVNKIVEDIEKLKMKKIAERMEIVTGS